MKYAEHATQCPITGHIIWVDCETVNPSGKCEHWEAKPKPPETPKKRSWWRRKNDTKKT
ncbi:hypothetical protein LCGC14_1245520 [marine sediment metagenome]|uniref:Uncharacterized protein n=1 Tax=marine sediment metagenome TaxID=412755 RepID=A0A0F9P8J9_9ZZZZ